METINENKDSIAATTPPDGNSFKSPKELHSGVQLD